MEDEWKKRQRNKTKNGILNNKHDLTIIFQYFVKRETKFIERIWTADKVERKIQKQYNDMKYE